MVAMPVERATTYFDILSAFFFFLIPLSLIWTFDMNSVLLEKEFCYAPFRLHTNLLSVAKGLTCSRTGSCGGRGSGARRDKRQQGHTNTNDFLKQT